jgi:TetR/AcrR family transcriptional repressor of nem operon
MSRPRQFDTDAVLDAAVAAFWSGGAGALSVDDLLRQTGLARSSLYNSFGSKSALLEQALQRYVDGQIAGLQQVFEGRDLHTALLRLFEPIARDNEGGKGCLLINTVHAQHHSPDLPHGVLQQGFSRMAAQLGRLAAERDDAKRSAGELAADIMTAIAGLRTLQKTGLPRSQVLGAARRCAARIANG